MKIKILNLFGLMLITSQILAQDFSIMQDLNFLVDGKQILNPYGGGIKSAQISQIDFNNDGKPDLFVFDRSSEVIYPFINRGEPGEINYKHEVEYAQYFPRMYSWVLLKDFNQDGIEDIFCSPTDEGIAGIRVYKGSRNEGELSFSLMTFPSYHNDVMWYQSFGSKYQVYVANTDVPGIVDVDKDGDLDVLSFDSGGAYLSYYQNQSVEKGFGLDSLIFEQKDACFGKFLESPFSEELFLSNDAELCYQQFTDPEETESVHFRHAGSTVNPYDINGDGLLDLLLGDLAYDGLVYLTNGGSMENAWMNQQFINFPDYDTPVDIDIFIAAFFPDVDLDGKDDLLVSLNQNITGQNKDNIWHYKNVSDDPAQIYELQTMNFLKEDGLLLGNRVIPKFADYNQDGLLDLIVSSQGFFGSNDPVIPRLMLFENIGTVKNPMFELKDADYLKMSEFATTSALFSHCLGDLDGDHDMDMLIGDESGYLYFMENIAGPNQTFEFAEPIYRYQNIRVGQTVNPYIFDFNEDGLGDIFIGERGKTQDSDFNVGVLNYLVNQGTVGDPQFTSVIMEPNTQVFGKINLTKYSGVVSSAPAVYDIGSACLVFIGTEDGEIHLYEGPKGNPGLQFIERSNNLGNIHIGRQSVIDIADIDNDNYLEMVMGGGTGSFFIYNTNVQIDGSVSSKDVLLASKIHIFPNPIYDQLHLTYADIQIKQANIFNLMGQQIISIHKPGNSIDLSHFQMGVYFIEFISEDLAKTTMKFIKSD